MQQVIKIEQSQTIIFKKVRSNTLKKVFKSWQLYLIILVPVAYLILFTYVPMYGAIIAFKNYSPVKGIFGSDWVGLKNFERFISSYQFISIMKNTLTINLYGWFVGVPIHLFLALFLNYIENQRFKKAFQNLSYAPHFISTVVLVGIVYQVLDYRTGILNNVVKLFGGEAVSFLMIPELFKHVFVWSGQWQSLGWGTIIYLAILSGIDPQLHESAIVDGANKLQRMWHIDIPGILPSVIIMQIMHCGKLLNVGFEKVLLMQNGMNLPVSEVIDTYVYKMGIISPVPNFSYATAIGLFKSVISLVLIILANQLAKKVSKTSLF